MMMNKNPANASHLQVALAQLQLARAWEAEARLATDTEEREECLYLARYARDQHDRLLAARAAG